MPDSAEKLRPGVEVGGETGLKEVVKRDEKVELPREVSSWLEQIERQQPNQNVVINDQKQQPIVTAPKLQYNGTKIPVTRSVFGSGFKKKVTDAGRWLSVFFLRLIKIKEGKVIFKDEDV